MYSQYRTRKWGWDAEHKEWTSLLSLAMSTNIHVFVCTHDGKRITLTLDLQITIIQVRRRIFDLLGIHLNCWRLFSFGGKLFWYNRTVADYDIQNRATLYVRLLLKGGTRKSKRRRGDSQFQQKRTSKTKNSENRSCSHNDKRR